MDKELQVIKAGGQIEPFSKDKLDQTLHQAGVDQKKRQQIIGEIFAKLSPQTSTKEIYHQAFNWLQAEDPIGAAKYNLRRAIMELGPTGFPFEQYVAKLLTAKGYQTQVGQMVPGACVLHEIDVIAQKVNQKVMIECKYHNRLGTRSDIKTALYVWARFEDIHQAWERDKKTEAEFHEVWLVTNTKMTNDAEDFAKCRSYKIISWYRPAGESLREMIIDTGLWPITCLTNLSSEAKRQLIAQNMVLCQDLLTLEGRRLEHLSSQEIKEAIRVAKSICRR